MSPKLFLALAALALGTLIAAVTSYAVNAPWSRLASGGVKLAPALGSDAARVATIEVRQGDRALTLKRTEQGWGVAERGGYPASVDKVRTLLRAIADAELLEAKTAKLERHGLLEVEDPAGKEAKSRLVKVFDDRSRVLAEIIVGKKRYDAFGSGKPGTYVRRGGDAQTWLSNADIEPSASITDWVKSDVLQIETGSINRLVVEVPGEEPLVIERAGDGKPGPLAIKGLAEGSKLKDANAADAIARAAVSITLDDVRPLAPASGDAGVSSVGIETADGLSAVLRLRKAGDDHWLSISVNGSGAAKAAADEIAARTSNWEYKIPALKAQAIFKRRDDLLQAS